MNAMLYHYASHPALANAVVGQEFTLNPGPQHAEGPGVYFAEAPRPGAADALVTGGKPFTGCVVIPRPATKSGWWVTSTAVARKKNRAKTWHTLAESVTCRVIGLETPFVHCVVVGKQPWSKYHA